jgi:hypothetical protein
MSCCSASCFIFVLRVGQVHELEIAAFTNRSTGAPFFLHGCCGIGWEAGRTALAIWATGCFSSLKNVAGLNAWLEASLDRQFALCQYSALQWAFDECTNSRPMERSRREESRGGWILPLGCSSHLRSSCLCPSAFSMRATQHSPAEGTDGLASPTHVRA